MGQTLEKINKEVIIIDSSTRSKRLKWAFASIILSVIGIIVFYSYIGLATLKRIQIADSQTGRSRFSFPGITTNRLKGESDDRINFLLIGIGGGKHPGGLLADTIILSSINPKTKQVALMSIPRDLYVPLPKPLSGYDKINATHSIGERDKEKTGGGIAYLRATVSEIFGQPIHYIMRVDFEGFKKIVDTLGGVTVSVEKPINDPFYPASNMVDYEPFSIKAGTQTLDGNTALKYVRSRETTSDFDRARRQQQVLQAIRDKALGLNVLANPKKLLDLAKIVGDHLKTDLSAWEMERLVTISKDIFKQNIITKVLDTSAGGPLASVNEGGYFIKPRDGTYQELKKISQNIFVQAPTTSEQAKIEIINASSVSGVGSKLADELTQLGLTITRISKQTTQSQSVIYDATAGKKPETIKLLTAKLKASVVTSRPPQLLDNSIADIVIIVGNET